MFAKNNTMTAIHPQFITDIKGNKDAAVIPIDEYNQILEEREELEDIFLYDQSKNDNQHAIFGSKAMKMIELERKKRGL